MKKKLVIYLALLGMSLSCFGEEINSFELGHLSHVKGCQSIGLRAGHGTKNLYDFGMTYTYCFNNKMSLLVEIDHEKWKDTYEFEQSRLEFTNVILVSPGIEHNLLNPCKWFYWHWGIGPAFGYDKWYSVTYDLDKSCFVYGAQAGTGVEFIPTTRWSIVLKAQQYALFSSAENYLKPNFSLAVRFNFHK